MITFAFRDSLIYRQSSIGEKCRFLLTQKPAACAHQPNRNPGLLKLEGERKDEHNYKRQHCISRKIHNNLLGRHFEAFVFETAEKNKDKVAEHCYVCNKQCQFVCADSE